MSILPLAALGDRIVISGPSNSGKSTLAVALARKLDVPAVHLDLLRHKPNTNWEVRPAEEFQQAHADAVAGEGWIIEGNYTSLFPPRLARATGVIYLGSEPVRGALRYFRRTLFEKGRRAGQLEGNIDRINFRMLHWILVAQPPKHSRDRDVLRAAGLPMVELASMSELSSLYEAWNFSR
ncbi:AAA family ATPase [Devosia sp. ZB163]|uniref:AAA family ATPase n=1 Tax=Devosia sp. ZB163 TaxID=3025938 RepID=UPI00235E8FFD|nr:AAA family ATPase [Devosia sp. ZB163]MDC9824731.1 AAA family ATPase [Devosia sp. ZB163]